MKLMRLGPPGAEKPSVWVSNDRCVDVSDAVGDFNMDFFAGGGLVDLPQLVRDRMDDPLRSMSLGGLRVGPPIARPHQIICVGLNYSDHAAEAGLTPPDEPVLFTKAPNSMVGPFDEVRMPRGATKMDWEVELGIVIGRRCRYLDSDDEASESIAGYMVVNDVTERAFQNERSGQWLKGKSAETFNPAGPWLVTPDEAGDPNDLRLWLDVNGARQQDGSTRTMIFDAAFLVRYISQFLVLEPGDLINTGTPGGVAAGQDKPRWLRRGDIMELGIEGLGSQRQKVI